MDIECSMSRLVDVAADAFERRLFFEDLATGYERLCCSPDAWEEIEAERTIESGALADRSAYGSPPRSGSSRRSPAR